MHVIVRVATLAVSFVANVSLAQSPTTPIPLTRAQAVEAALTRGAALAIARADTSAAFAQLISAGARPNPALSASYSRSTPQYHFAADLPIDLSGVRGARIRAAQIGRDAAFFRLMSARAAVELTADTSYTRALAARSRLALSLRNARAADSLRLIAVARRDAGDASDLDVELATVYASQQLNVLATDSLTSVSAILDLQSAIGLLADDVQLSLTDSLGPPPLDSITSVSVRVAPGPLLLTVPVAAAQAALESARLRTFAERRAMWTGFGLTAGFETHDPSGAERGILPTIGISLPLPLFDRNRGPIALADAEREMARAELAVAQLESRTEVARARRAVVIAADRARRGAELVATADRVATKSITAYREGASPLSAVLEAQRNARDILADYIQSLADAWVATATIRALTRPAPSITSAR
ncbi:MAG: TolC family protein [Gemmatimonadaceae bacterium]